MAEIRARHSNEGGAGSENITLAGARTHAISKPWHSDHYLGNLARRTHAHTTDPHHVTRLGRLPKSQCALGEVRVGFTGEKSVFCGGS